MVNNWKNNLLGGLGHVFSKYWHNSFPTKAMVCHAWAKAPIFAGVAIAIFTGLKRSIGIVVNTMNIYWKHKRITGKYYELVNTMEEPSCSKKHVCIRGNIYWKHQETIATF